MDFALPCNPEPARNHHPLLKNIMNLRYDPTAHALSLKRRAFLTQSAYGLGGLALASIMNRADAAPSKGAITTLHYPARAKRVIHLCMAGGPSHL